MRALTDQQRQDFATAWAALAARDAEIEAARKPLDDALKPFIRQACEVEEEREQLIDRIGADFAGKCESCSKPLFCGDLGSRPYGDEASIIYCAEHGLTYADLRRSWEDVPADEDDEDRADSRRLSMALVDGHLSAGGALTDIVPPYEL